MRLRLDSGIANLAPEHCDRLCWRCRTCTRLAKCVASGDRKTAAGGVGREMMSRELLGGEAQRQGTLCFSEGGRAVKG